MTAGERLDAIRARLYAATADWVAAGYPMDGPIFQRRKNAYAELHRWNHDSGAYAAATCARCSATLDTVEVPA